MTTKVTSHEAYLQTLNPDQQEILRHLRTLIRESVPEGEECISYSLPAFRYRGKILIGYGASAQHCALYLFSSLILPQFKSELEGFDVSKGTLRFQPESPPSKSLVQALIQAKIQEIAA